MPEPANTDASAIDEHARVSVPRHVVYRTFVTETVALNIETGQYHGLNVTAGRMLDALDRRGTVNAAVQPLAEEFGQPAERIRADLLALCASLRTRGLIVLGESDVGA